MFVIFSQSWFLYQNRRYDAVYCIMQGRNNNECLMDRNRYIATNIIMILQYLPCLFYLYNIWYIFYTHLQIRFYAIYSIIYYTNRFIFI